NDVTQSQSASLEQMSASFNELANHADVLKGMMERFELMDDSSEGPREHILIPTGFKGNGGGNGHGNGGNGGGNGHKGFESEEIDLASDKETRVNLREV
ncbi:MAG: hypothetical protein OEZ36_13135, partial [Spirochaetota bacterium]|nr:hypothetical protein [Spirochaetota bacterium]